MFSSLEALDGDDHLNVAPVARQGAFQPKAKPRVRKGGVALDRTPSSVPANKQETAPPSSADAADDIGQPERNQVNLAMVRDEGQTEGEIVGTVESFSHNLAFQSSLLERNFGNQSVDIAPEFSNQDGYYAESSQQLRSGVEDLPPSHITETAGGSRKKESPCKAGLLVSNQVCLMPSKEAAVVEEGMTSETRAKPMMKEKKGGCNGLNEQQQRISDDPTLNLQKKTKRAKVINVAMSDSAVEVSVGYDTCQEAVMEGAAAPVKKKRKGIKQAQEGRDDGEQGQNMSPETSSKNKKARLVASPFTSAFESTAEVAIEVSGDNETDLEAVETTAMKLEPQKAEGQQDIGETNISLDAHKRKRRKPARYLDGADDDEINDTLLSVEPTKKSSRCDSQIDEEEGIAENELLSELFPSLPKKVSKLKQVEIGSTNAIPHPGMSGPPAKGGRKARGSCKSVTPASNKCQKKIFKKHVLQRRRVDRRAINPADPDLDPKKMTMKDIIRLAEAKDRMLKRENTKVAKNGNQVTVNEPEREPEHDESACMAPQVQIVNGQIVINEQSLVVNARPKDDIRTYKRVEETHTKLNYHSYMKRTPTQLWKSEETELFYKALQEFGTNFAMIQHLFPGRTRKQVFLKFKKEEKRSPLRISEALRVKPCETSHFLEVMSSLNLLPSDIVEDELESVETSVPLELSSSKKEREDSNQILEEGDRLVGGGGGCVLKLDESSVHTMKQEGCGKSRSLHDIDITSYQCDNQELQTLKPSELVEEVAKPCESPKKESSPPRKKKSLFSYQASISKS